MRDGNADSLCSVAFRPSIRRCRSTTAFQSSWSVLVPALPEVVTGQLGAGSARHADEAIHAVLEYRRAHGLAVPADAPPEIRRVTVAAEW